MWGLAKFIFHNEDKMINIKWLHLFLRREYSCVIGNGMKGKPRKREMEKEEANYGTEWQKILKIEKEVKGKKWGM